MISRHLEQELHASMKTMPVVTLIGPRQSGKTTLVRSVLPKARYVNLERPDLRQRIAADPAGFLAELDGQVILDEVQRLPELLSWIQVAVDEDPTPGQFVLTGSHNLLLMDSVAQTLAGRTRLLTLLPLSVAEVLGRSPLEPEKLGQAGMAEAPVCRDLWPLVFRGMYPRLHGRDLDPTRWLADYRRTYVERDLREVLRVMDLEAFDRFLRLVAARTACELNLSALAGDAGISQPTARQWLGALEVGFITTRTPMHAANYRKRLRRRPKMHMLDSGLTCHLLGISTPEMLRSHPLRGAIFESFIVAELMKAFTNRGLEPPIFTWRDSRGREIDIILDLGSELLPIEVKSGRTVASDATRTLRWWLQLPGNHSESGALVHGGHECYGQNAIQIRPWWIR